MQEIRRIFQAETVNNEDKVLPENARSENEKKESKQLVSKRKVITLINRIGIDPAEKIGRLPKRYRDILRMYYIDEKTDTEIAQLSGQPKNTIKSLVHRGRKMLFEYWG